MRQKRGAPVWHRAKAQTVDEYLAELPPDRREAMAAVRQTILDHLPAGYEEMMEYGMIGYAIPLERYPKTYNGHPLGYVALACQKNYMALYPMHLYGDAEAEWFRARYQASGKKLDMGKACLRFKRLEDLPLDVIGEAIALTPPDEYIRKHEASRIR
ncbi:MAG: DUF1801 domain-containing protein [Dehalococcoidia bacterium]